MTTADTAARPLMRAVTPVAWGEPDVLTEITLERPEPAPVEILVRVHAAGLNATDWKSRRSGGLGLWSDPPILGYDVSGVVEEVGIGVTLFAPGDEVFGMPRFPRQAGAYAQYVTAPPRHFARKPAGIDHVQAAALPLAALTAWQSLVDTADVQVGQRVLIHAAAGGFGHLAVQIAKARGAYVIGTARRAKHGLLTALGADELIDYTEVDFAQAVGDVDIVLDTIGGDYAGRSLATMRDDGTLVSLSSPFEPPAEVVAAAAARGIKTGFMLVEPDHRGLQEVAALVEAGRLRAEIAAVLPLDRAAEAHAIGETGRTTGKLVLQVAD
jgi:NADPH:quinone reductase-like Zn-dependent oxidoreductase